MDLARLMAHRALNEHREESARTAIMRLPAAIRSDAVLQQLLGLLHRARSDLAPALAALDRALAAMPADPRLVHTRARAGSEAGLDADTWFDRARALAPNDGDVILGYAAHRALTGRGAAADASLGEMLSIHPGWLAGHWALLQMRYAAGNPEWLSALDRAIAGAPGDLRLHAMKIRVLQRAERVDETDRALAVATTATGDPPELRAIVASIATERGRLADADAAFATFDPLAAPETVVAWLRHLVRRGDADRIAALAPRLGDAALAVAWPYLSIAWRMLGDARAAWLDDPKLVRVVDVPLSADELAALAATLRTLHVAQSQPLDQSVRGGTQTEGPLLSRVDPTLVAIRDRLRAAVDAYVADLPRPDTAHPLLGRIPREPRFQGSWSVRLAGGGHHDAHVHTEGWLSSAFYVALPGEDDAAGTLALGAPQESLHAPVGTLATVAPRPGRLVLFPSTLWHGTRPFASGERLTIAFDIA